MGLRTYQHPCTLCQPLSTEEFTFGITFLKLSSLRQLYESHIRTNLSDSRAIIKSGEWFKSSFKYNQQDSTLYSTLYYFPLSTCFRRFLRPSSGIRNSTHNIWYMSSLLDIYQMLCVQLNVSPTVLHELTIQ